MLRIRLETLKSIIDERGHHVCTIFNGKNASERVIILSYENDMFFDNTGNMHSIADLALLLTVMDKDGQYVAV